MHLQTVEFSINTNANKLFIKALIVLIFTTQAALTLANEASYFSHYMTENGLANNTVNSIAQDKHGFMWFATGNGISRFDGYHFINYYPKPHVDNSLSSKDVSDIVITADNELWLSTHTGGLNHFKPYEQSITVFTHDENKPDSIRSNYIQCLYLTDDEKLWIGSNDGLDLYIPESRKFKHIDLNIGQTGKPAKIMINDITHIGQYLWLATSHGLIQYNSVNQDANLFRTPQNNPSGYLMFLSVYADKNQRLWVGTNSGLYLFNHQTLQFDHNKKIKKSFQNILIRKIREDQAGNIWLGTNKGAYQIHHSLNKIRHFSNNTFANNTLNDNHIMSLYIDKQQNIWLGTFLGGVNQLSRQGDSFGLVRMLHEQNQLRSNQIHYLYEDPFNNIWIKNNAAIQRFNPHTGLFDNPLDSLKKFDHNIYEQINSLAGLGDELWIGTTSQGLIQYNVVTGAVQRHQVADNTGLTSNQIRHLYADKNRLWVDSIGGLLFYEPQTEQFIPFASLTKITPYYFPGNILDIHTDTKGYTWIASYRGLVQFKDQQLIAHHYYQKGNLHGLNDSHIFDVEEDSQGQLWIASGNSLQKYNYEQNSFETAIVENLPEGGEIYSLLIDRKHRIWLGTNKGLVVYHIINSDSRVYRQEDGLQGNDFYIQAKLLLKNGKIAFGGVNGFNLFDPEKILQKTTADVSISRIELNDQVYHYHPGYDLELPYKHNNFTLNLSTLEYHNSKATTFAYTLSNDQEKWQELDKGDRKVSFNNLQPGTYVFKAKALNSSGLWSKESQLLTINILSPWWLSIYAYSAWFLLAIMFIYGLIRFKTHRLHKKSQLLESIVEERTREIQQQKVYIQEQNENLELLMDKKDRIFSNISHEFRTPLTLILGPLKSLVKIASDTQKKSINIIQSNAYRLLRLVDQLLELSKLHADSNSPNASCCQVVEVLDAIIPSFQTLAESKNISIKLLYKQHCLVACSYDSLEKILVNLLSNAIKYTLPDGNIDISVQHKETENSCQIIVRDTGIGIPEIEIDNIFDAFTRIENPELKETIPGTGIGLALVKELVEFHAGEILVDSSLGEGSCFTVNIPTTDNDNYKYTHIKNHSADEASLEIIDLAKTIRQELQAEKQTIDQEIPIDDNKPVILIIEDNPDMRQYLYELCSPHYQCLTAENGKKGATLAIEYIPDLIISDIMMPEEDGYGCLHIVKGDRRSCHIPVILLTALKDREYRIRALRANADDILTKPFDSEELILRINNLLSIRQMIKVSDHICKDDESEVKSKSSEINELDQLFLDHFRQMLEKYHNDETLDTLSMSRYLLMSDRQLYRKIKALTGKTPVIHLRNLRLEKAEALLLKGHKIENVAYDVGFAHRTYFSRCFKEKYGLNPKEYQKASKSAGNTGLRILAHHDH